ncbi:AAA family ATPase [Gelidibacter sp.]|uniref:AAA family ATPase n=1 Tax=Gelidibacter sp. TaxID=2018083 RepID=UPI0032653715
MKILKIRFENIHSLKGQHEVDFGNGPLAEAGLFAITGPTGSGKSTLLDVITLALYNRIARVDKPVSNSMLDDDGGVMTRNMKHCFAEVEYRVNGKDYRSHWSIERNRNNNLNARKQELVEVSTGHILESGTKTPDKNLEIIGLSYDQFVKAMVLSQGEFSKLLQAPRNERNQLLEDITGARSYRDIGKAVFFRYKSIQKDIDLKEAGLESIELLSPELIAEKKAEIKLLTETKPKIEKAYQTASDKIKTREELQIKEKEWKTLDDEKLSYTSDFNVFEPYKTKLDTHEKLSKYGVHLRDFDAVNKEVDNLKEQLKQLQTSKSEAVTHQKTYLETVSTLIKENVDITSANLKLDAFRSKIVALESEEKKKKDEATLHQTQLQNYVRHINTLGYQLPKAEYIETFQPQFEALQKTVQEAIKISGINSLEQLEATLASNRELNEKAGDFLMKKENALKFKTTLESHTTNLKSAEESLKADLKKIAVMETELVALKKEVQTLETNLEQQRKHQSLEDQRLLLTPEQPCPLCGSLDHPYALNAPHFDAKAELLKEKKDALETKSSFVITLGEKNKFQEREIIRLKSEIQTTTTDATNNHKLLTELAAQLQWNPEETLELLQHRRSELNKSIQQVEHSKKAFQAHSVLNDATEVLEHWQGALKIYAAKKKERIALYEQDDINQKSNELATKISHSIATIASVEKQIKDNDSRLKSSTNDLATKKQELDNILLKEDLEHLELLRKSILSEDVASRIRKQESVLNERKTRISEKETALHKILKELKEKDDDKLSFEVLTSLFETSKTERETLLVNLGKITQRLDDDTKARERQQKVLEILHLMKKDLALWKTMNDLVGDATGNKFSNFVQDLTLEQLIGFANKRLSEFSDRYLLDIPTAEEAEKSDTLKIFDSYMGNARRSVKTLSGGETFLVSLAMAFALSDIASRNVKIESLFIDEGFGTLDPETLDQAITILEKMQNEGDKSVGVISHVSALKERITTQIKLEKGSLGYSTLDVVR